MRTMAEEKVWITSLHLEGVAADWYYALERDHAIPSWARFAEFVNMRFGPPLRTNSLAELKDLRRTGSVEEYQRQFSVLLCRCDDLSPSQQVNMFTAGLGEPLRTDVELQNPTTLQYAMSLARAYERRTALPTGTALPKSFRSNTRSSADATTGVTTTPSKPAAPAKQRFKRLTMEEMATKRANGECYHCPAKYTADHKCPVKGVFLLELDDDIGEDEAVEELGISLHALTGIKVAETMKLQITVGGTQLVALVDTGSTDTFIKEEVAGQLGLLVEPCHGLFVKVANGDRVGCNGVCPRLPITIHTEDFNVSCYVLPLDSFDVVLGVRWLRSLGPILWDFAHLSMSFWRHGRTVRWTGVGSTSPQCAMLSTSRELLQALLDDYADIFAMPQGLPPPRRHDHRIRLLPGTAPVAVRPYRYPQLLKDELERQCDDMLQQGIIRECTSAFTSPVLLVRKPDGTWRFCIDYRELNEKTVKDKFPIPVVDELLDEL
jgi:hypothetical protein